MFASNLLLVVSLLSSHGDTVARQLIERELAALVRIDTIEGPIGRERVVGFAVDQPNAGTLLGPFLRTHGRLVWYLAVHTPGAEARLVRMADDPLLTRDSIISVLRTNTEFNDRFLRMLASYWRASGRTIAGYASAATKTRIPALSLRRVGARFFYPDRMSATGDTMYTHICAGINGISDLPEKVDPLVEAFVFVAVNSALLATPHSRLMQAFDTAFARAKATSVSTDPAKRILRAQGAMWAQMEQSPAMTVAISNAYDKHGSVMPFRLVPGVP